MPTDERVVITGRVWCRKCGRSVPVHPAVALKDGWPKCHGLTMTIDHPSHWVSSRARHKAIAADEQRRKALEATDAD